MFKENSRIINKNGILFDEEDVLLSKYIHNNDISIKINLEAQGEAIGFVFVPFDEQQNNLAKHNYMIRLTQNRIDVLMNRKGSYKIIKEQAVNISRGRMFVTCIKEKNQITIFVDKNKKFSVDIPNIEKYQFGIYSTSNNKIYNIDIKTPSPMRWNANMKNTKGGVLKYIKNGFTLYECKEDAEIIQDNIPMRKGLNYLKFEKSINSDIEPYVFKSDDTRVDDDKKNIITKINDQLYSIFSEKNGDLYTLKFKGKHGTIKNISISMNINDDFIPTEEEDKIDGSKLIVDTRYIKEIIFQGVIRDTPSNDKYFIISNLKEVLKNELDLKEEFVYLIVKDTKGYIINIYNPIKTELDMFDTYKKESPIFSTSMDFSDTLEIFYSVDAIMSKFLYKTKDGSIVNIIKDKELIVYTENNSIAPIIVMSNNEPLELTGSYRVDNGRYIFTNKKRESFESSRLIKLSKPISKQDDIVTLYGVNEEDIVDKTKINHINNIDNLDLFAKKYDTFSEVDIDIDKDKQYIIFDQYQFYDYIVVDYLMDETYTLNKIKGTNLYKIEVSTVSENIQIVYEHKNYINYNEGKKVIDKQALDNTYISLEMNKGV